MLGNLDTLEAAYQTAEKSAGSAAREQENYAKSIQYSIDQVIASVEELSYDFLDSGMLKQIIDSANSFLQVLDKIVERTDGLVYLVGGLAATMATIKKMGVGLNYNKGSDSFSWSIFGQSLSSDPEMESLKEFANLVEMGERPVEAYKQSIQGCSKELRQYVVECVKGKKSTDEIVNGFKVGNKTSKAFSSAIKSLGASLVSLGINFAISAALSAVVSLVMKLADASKELAEESKKLGQEFHDTTDDLESYKKQISELYKVIDDSASSYEDTKAARERLLGIQDELITKYGSEKGAIEDVTTAINNQVEALDNLREREWEQTKRDINKPTDFKILGIQAGGIVDWAKRGSSDSKFDRILDSMQKISSFNSEFNEFGNINTVSNGGARGLSNLKLTKSDVLLLEQLTEAYKDLSWEYNEVDESWELVGKDMRQFEQDLLSLYDQVKLFGGSKDLERFLDKTINGVQALNDANGSLYDEYIKNEKILKSADYAKGYDDITEAVKKYNEEYSKATDEAGQQKAIENLANVWNSVVGSIDDAEVREYFERMYPALKQTVDSWTFKVEFEADPKFNKDYIQHALEQFKTDNNGYVSVESLQKFAKDYQANPENYDASDERVLAYKKLEEVASHYEMTVEALIQKLYELKMVETDTYNELVSKYGEDKIKELSPEDYEIAVTLSKNTFDSWEAFYAAIQKVKEERNAVAATEVFTDENKLKSYISTLNEVSNALMSGTELTKEQLTALRAPFEELEKQFPQLGNDIQVLNEEFLQGTNVWADALANVKAAVLSIQLDKLGDEFEEASKEAKGFKVPVTIDKAGLEDFESKLDSYIESDKDISIAIHADISDNLKTMSDTFSDINEAAATVGKNFRVGFEDIEKLSAIFPGILDGMTMLKDGTVQLNKEVAQSVIESVRAEADADSDSVMQRLELQATLLENKAATYKAMAQAAAKLAGNEISTEEDKADALAVIDAGLNEIEQINAQLTEQKVNESQKSIVDASKTDSEIMDQNWHGAAQDVSDSMVDMANNGVTAQNNMAQGFFTARMKVSGGSFSGSTAQSNETNLLTETRKALEKDADLQQQAYQDLETRYLEAAAVAEKAAATARDGVSLIKANKKFTDYNLSNVEAGKAGKTSSENTQEYKQVIDYFEQMVKVIDHSISMLEAHLEDVTGAFAKNTLLSAEQDQVKAKLDGYASAIEMYSQKASEELAKIPSDIAEKLINGAVDIDTFIDASDKEVVEAIQNYQSWADKINDANLQLVQLKETLRQLELQKFNNILEDFNNQIDLRQSSGIDLISKQIELLKEAGELVGESYYKKQIELTKKNLASLEDAKSALADQMNEALNNGIDVGSDEWLEMVKTLTELEGKILDAKKALEEFDNALLELHTEVFNMIQDQFDSYENELSNLRGLFSEDKIADDNGEYTKEGLAQLGLLAQEYELAKYRVEQYNKEIAQLNADYKAGKYSAAEYAQKLAELKQKQWENVNAAEEAKKAMIELEKARVEIAIEAIEKEIDAFEKLIEAEKEALKSEKELNEYRKSIRDANKSIIDVQKQLAAIEGDNSASAIARRKKLEEQLSEAKQKLSDLEADHEYDTKVESLDKQLEAYKEMREKEIEDMKKALEDIEATLEELFQKIRDNAEQIGDTIEEEATEHGIQISDVITSAWNQGEDAINKYGETLDSNASAFIENLNEVENNMWKLQDDANATADTLANMFGTRADELVTQLTDSYNSEANLDAMTNALHQSLSDTIDGRYSGASAVSAVNEISDAVAKLQKELEDAKRKYQELLNQEQSGPKKRILWSGKDKSTAIAQAKWYGYDESHVEQNGDMWQVWGYKKGTQKVTKDQLAWTQEEGPEMIISPSAGAILTPLKMNDAVIPADMTSNLWEWGKFNPEEFAEKLLNSTEVPNGTNVQNNTMEIGSLVTVNGNVNDSAEMMQIAAQQASVKIKQSFYELSNGLNKQ